MLLLLLVLLLVLLLLGVLAVALAMNACLRLVLLALVPLPVTLLTTNKALVVLVPTVPLCFHPSGLSMLASVVFVSSIALKLGSRSSYRSSVTLCFPLLACSIVGLNYSLVPMLLVYDVCLLYTSPSPRDRQKSRMPSSA